MEHTKRTKQETIEYFKQLAHEYKKLGARNNDEVYLVKAETYELVAFELENNME